MTLSVVIKQVISGINAREVEMKKPRPLGVNKSRAWVAGWDASITCGGNPYKRRDYAGAFNSGRLAGKRSNADDVRILNLMLSRIPPRRRPAGSVIQEELL